MDITLNRTETLPPLVTYLVRGRRINDDGTVSEYTGMSWGRTPEDARRRHERLNAADRRIREATRTWSHDIDLDGYELEFVALAPC